MQECRLSLHNPSCYAIALFKDTMHSMAVASGPAGPVLAGPVFERVFGIAHAQNSNSVKNPKTTIMHVPVNAYLPPAAQL